MGWEQKLEDPPIVDLNLIAAIAQLQPSKSMPENLFISIDYLLRSISRIITQRLHDQCSIDSYSHM